MFRGGVDVVNVGVTVSDRKGKLIAELTADDFELLEDGKPQKISFFVGSAAPRADLHLGLLLDVSESMEDDIAFTRTAAIRFLNKLTEAVDVTLVDFDSEVRAARYGPAEFARLIERIRRQQTRGDTALFDAIGVYLDGAADQHGRKVMLLYTDGGDTRSALREGELIDLVKASDVTIYAIGIMDRRSSAVQAQHKLLLRRIVETAGGQVFFPPSVTDLDKVYEQVAAEIRAQYTLGYVSSNAAANGAWRKIEINLKRSDAKELRVRSRRGYYAPYRP